MALFKAYVDESADTEDVFFVVGGFVARDPVWDPLESEWLSALAGYCRFFHATECFAGTKQFAGIEASRRERLVHALTDILVRKDVHLVACGLRTKGYKRLAPRPKANAFLGNRYLAAFGGVVQVACEFARSPISPNAPHSPTGASNVCAFVIEDSEYSGGAKRQLREMGNDPLLWWRGSIGKETFGEKEGPNAIPLLQVADLGAFLAAKKLGRSPEGQVPWRQFYDKLARAQRVLRVVDITDGNLKTLHDLSHTP